MNRVAVAVASAAIAIALVHDVRAQPEVNLPPGTRSDPGGYWVSGTGLRDATDYIARDLERRHIVAKQIGPYRVRSTELTRFISGTETTPWIAIHLLRRDGKTLIFFVPRPKDR